MMSQLRDRAPVILPSLLLCDFGNLEREVRRLEDGGARALHLDVMDGHFVPNFTYGMPIVEAFRKLTELPLDVHLMVTEPTRYLKAFREAGADLITVHAEAVESPGDVLREIRSLGACSGLAINPATPIDVFATVWDDCDLGLVMSVPAGFGGQSFDRRALTKLEALRAQAPQGVALEVDGGVNLETISECSESGADWFVVGSAIFRQDDYAEAISALTQAAKR